MDIIGRDVHVSTTAILGHNPDLVRFVKCKIIADKGLILGRQSYDVQDDLGNVAKNLCFGAGIIDYYRKP